MLQQVGLLWGQRQQKSGHCHISASPNDHVQRAGPILSFPIPLTQSPPHLLKMVSHLNASLRNSTSHLAPSMTVSHPLSLPGGLALSHRPDLKRLASPRTSSPVPWSLTHFTTRHLPNLSRTIVTTADTELLAWAWAMPAEKPSIWALTLARLPAQTPGIWKDPWASLVATGPGQSLSETLAPSSGRPDGVTTEPRRTWLGHPHMLGLHPGRQREAERKRNLLIKGAST